MNARKMAGIVAVATVLLTGGLVMAAHAPWPADWNNWSDPNLMVTVGNPGNAGEWSGESYGGHGRDRICGAVGFTYKMGKFEVTAGQYTAFLNAVAKTDTYGLYNTEMGLGSWGSSIQRNGSPGSYSYSVAEDWANRPVTWLSWGDAARFCNWLTNGKLTGAQVADTTEDGSYCLNGATAEEALLAVTRKPNARYVIPSEDEWYKAAYYDPNKPGGAGYWDYPTGSDSTPSNPLVSPDPGNNANFVASDYTYTVGDPYYTTEVGDFENSHSPYGTFDQGGNLWEWNDTVMESSATGYTGVGRGMRGGGYFNYIDDLAAGSGALWLPPDCEHWSGVPFGFRIAEVPEPATLALLALGALALIRRR